ncbi:MAG: alanine racemase [Campylobacterales bacterium]|nr:alanine racemase [Campylobacterales bacterium]
MAFITLDRKAFHHNLNMISKQLQSREKIALVLKDNAYGHGLKQVAQIASKYGIGRAVVRTIEEAEQVRNKFKYILVLADIPAVLMPAYCFTVNAMEQIKSFPPGSRVELKVDTGMHRNGVPPHLLHHAFEKISKNGLKLEGVFTHHRSADEMGSEYFWQRHTFESVKREALMLAKRYGFSKLRFHSANSAATFRSQEGHDDMVRVGIAAYGCLEMPKGLPQPDLLPILSLWGEKISQRRLNQGERVGYGGCFSADRQMQISNYDVGYADGLLRTASNRYTAPGGEMLLGRVSMDNCSFAGEAEQLLIFDDARSYAAAAGTISYEVLVGLHPRLPRKIIE